MRRRWLAPLGLSCAALACGSHATSQHSGQSDAGDASAPAAWGAVGASIAVLAGAGRVVVVNPDVGSISFLDPESLAVTGTTAVGGEPHALIEAGRGGATSLFVASYRGGEVVEVDEASGAVVARASVCAGPYGLAASPDRTWLAVSCEWDGTVQRVDTATLAVSKLASGLRRPRAVAVAGSAVWVADYVGGMVHEITEDGSTTTTSLVPASAPYRPALAQMNANLASAMVPAFGALYVTHVLENNAGTTTVEPEADDYGSVVNTNPKINPSVSVLSGAGADLPVTYAEYDGGARVYSGPSAIAAFGGRYLLVAHVSTANVAVIDTQAKTVATRSVGTYEVGFGPAGIAVDEGRLVAYVDNAFDGSVSKLDLGPSASTPYAAPASSIPAAATLVRSLPTPYSQAAQAGRRLFFDATNPHVTPSGVVACASCHPGGSDDGLVWFIHTANIPLKRRRTPHLANAKTETAPFHWNGQFATMSDLVENTMTNLMAGDGLLVDVSTVQPFIDEIVQAPVLPVTDAASVARGKALFDASPENCSVCHSGSYFTDDKMHAVLQPMSLTSDDVFPTANTPGLHGMFLMAPYFHDGRAATLTDVLTQPYANEMDHTTGLSASEVADLVAYLNSL
jgi:mono/diheme cytochrome c family protein